MGGLFDHDVGGFEAAVAVFDFKADAISFLRELCSFNFTAVYKNVGADFAFDEPVVAIGIKPFDSAFFHSAHLDSLALRWGYLSGIGGCVTQPCCSVE